MPGRSMLVTTRGFGGVWYVANVSGTTPAATPLPTTLNTLSPSGSGGY
jgi:hypothetical protein